MAGLCQNCSFNFPRQAARVASRLDARVGQNLTDICDARGFVESIISDSESYIEQNLTYD